LGDLVLASGFINKLALSDDVDNVFLLTQKANLILQKYFSEKVIFVEFNHPRFIRNYKKSYLEFFLEVIKLRRYFSGINISNTFLPYVGYPSIIPWLFLIKNNHIAGFTNCGYSSLLDIKLNFSSLARMHESKLGQNLLNASDYIGNSKINTDPMLYRTVTNYKKTNKILLHMGVGDSKRQWNSENWNKLVQELRIQNEIVIIASSDAELQYINKNILMSNGVEILDTRSDLSKFEQALLCCKLIIGLESFGIHFAGALGCDGIGIYTGISGAERMKPLGNIQILTKNMKCSPCYTKVCETRNCINDVTSGDLMKKVNLL
jgi:ADP-heptose:LPS heptosyltransferase